MGSVYGAKYPEEEELMDPKELSASHLSSQ